MLKWIAIATPSLTTPHMPTYAPSEKSKYTVELEMRNLLGVGESWLSSV